MNVGDIVRVHDSFGKAYDTDGYLFNGKIGIVLSVGKPYKDVKMMIEGKTRDIHYVYLEVINEERARG